MIRALNGAFSGAAEIPFAVPVTAVVGSPLGYASLDGWPDQTVPRQIKYRVELLESALELTRRGLCALYIPEFVAELHNKTVASDLKLTQLPLPKRISKTKMSIHVAVREGEQENVTLKKVAAAVRRVCK